MSDAEGYALEYLLDQITGNALTPAEAISMAIDLMIPPPDPDYAFEHEQNAAYQTVSAWPPAQQHNLITNLILNAADPLLVVSDLYDHVEQTLDTSPRTAVQSEWQAKRDAILQAFTRMLPNRPQQPERDQAFYCYHDANQRMEAVTGRAAAGESLSNFEQDVLRELDAEDDHREDADDRG